MTRFQYRRAGLALAFTLALASPVRAGAPTLVGTPWLAAHLNDPNLVVLHVASLRRDYDSGHVPGARYLWVGALAQGTPEMSFEEVPAPQARAALEALGVSDRSRIVLCGVGGNIAQAARMAVALDYLGLGDSTSVLDGQFDAWKAEGRPVSKDAPKVTRGTLRARTDDDVFVSAEWIRDRLHTPGVTIVDARAPQFWKGQSAGQPRAGHIPGAKNLFFSTVTDSTGHELPEPALRALFEKAGVPAGQELAVYCHVGQTASAVYVAARSLGYKVHLYDGSFDEWGGRMDLPVEVPPADSTARK